MDAINRVLGYLKDRLKEESTKKAIIILAGLAGYSVSPESLEQIMVAVIFFLGLFEAFKKES